MKNMQYQMEKVLTVRNDKGDLVAMFVHDIQGRKIVPVTCPEMNLDQIQELLAGSDKKDFSTPPASPTASRSI